MRWRSLVVAGCFGLALVPLGDSAADGEPAGKAPAANLSAAVARCQRAWDRLAEVNAEVARRQAESNAAYARGEFDDAILKMRAVAEAARPQDEALEDFFWFLAGVRDLRESGDAESRRTAGDASARFEELAKKTEFFHMTVDGPTKTYRKRKVAELAPPVVESEETATATVGPWRLTIRSFETKSKFQWDVRNPLKESGREPKEVPAKVGESLAIVTVRAERRRSFDAEELKSIESSPWKQWAGAGTVLFGTSDFLPSVAFTLLHVVGTGPGAKVHVADSPLMVLGEGIRLSEFRSGERAGYVPTDEHAPVIRATIVFPFQPNDEPPLLMFQPTPDVKGAWCARITSAPGADVVAEWGALESMKRHLPEAVKTK